MMYEIIKFKSDHSPFKSWILREPSYLRENIHRQNQRRLLSHSLSFLINSDSLLVGWNSKVIFLEKEKKKKEKGKNCHKPLHFKSLSC